MLSINVCVFKRQSFLSVVHIYMCADIKVHLCIYLINVDTTDGLGIYELKTYQFSLQLLYIFNSAEHVACVLNYI